MKSETEKSGRFLIVAIFFLLLISTAQGAWDNDDLMYAKSTAEIRMPVHNNDTAENFETIQDAIDDPDTKDGHNISVDAGIYRERVVINKQLKLIGENKDTTTIDAYGSGNCIKVTADNVEISGFTIKNGNYGIYLESSNCRVIDNNIASIDFDGIFLSNSINNTIAHNSISKVKRRGIRLSSSCNNRIDGNDLSENGKGISLSSSHNNTINHSGLTDNSDCGICLSSADNNKIRDNDLSGSEEGIFLRGCNKNYIYHNNFIENRIQASDSSDTNRWDNGPIDGGNYWSDHKCTGNPSDGNQPYIISGGIMGATDFYPFMDRDGWLTPPSPPTLTDPGTNDTDGNYIVRWSKVSSATNYTLEEDTNSSFSSPTKVYSGSGTSKEISGKSNGTYYYQVMACNAWGCSDWSNKENITIKIDTILPTVTISYPTSGQTFTSSNITVSGTASDNVEVSKVEVKVGLGGWQTASGTTSWNKSVTLAPGPNTINARAADTSENTKNTSVMVICDITPPVIYHENISNATGGEFIPISATITDNTTKVASATLFYRITGEGAWITISMDHVGDNYSATIPASHVTPPVVEYYIEAVDDVLNTANKPATAPTTPYSITVITIDSIPPTVTISYPTSEQMFNTTTITVNGTASDDVEVSKVEVKVGSESWQTASGTTSWNISVTLETGQNTIYARAADTAGNNKNASVKVICDITPPVIYHENITTATEGESIPISATITDSTTKVANANLSYRITGEEVWITISMDHVGDNYSATIPASHVTPPVVEYYIEAVDDVSNIASRPATAPEKPYSITVRGESSVTISAVPSTINLSESVNISGIITRAHSANVTLTFTTPNNATQKNSTTSTPNGSYYFVFPPEEVGRWTVNATWAGDPDTAGNTSKTISFTVNADNVGYAIIIVGRRDNDRGSKACNISANKAYNVLMNRSFTNESIFYLNPSKGQGVDTISSSKKIDDAISWAYDNVSANVPLFIYMVGHCENEAFIVNGTNDKLTASSMNNFLNNLTNGKGCEDITVVCEAGNSGCFIDNLSYYNDSSQCGRIIVSSTGVDYDAHFDEEGGQFSLYFFRSIYNGKTIEDAFENASNNPFLIQWGMKPLLDDNGDKEGHTAPLPNEGDGLVAKSKYIGTQANGHSYNNRIPAIRLEGV